MVPCRVIYLFGQGKGAQARGWTDEGGTEIFEGGTCPPVPPPSDAPVRTLGSQINSVTHPNSTETQTLPSLTRPGDANPAKFRTPGSGLRSQMKAWWD